MPTRAFRRSQPIRCARSSATGTFSRKRWARSGSLSSPRSPFGISPASKLNSATCRPASPIAASTSSSASPAGHQNSTASKPARAARSKRSRNGTSLKRIETLAQNFIQSPHVRSRRISDLIPYHGTHIMIDDATIPDATARAATVLRRADALAACTEEPGRLTRRFATPALRDAGDLVLGWMRDAGMTARRDAIGNVVGRWEPPAATAAPAETLLLGSHLDTVRDAGRYDGMLGVLVALAVVEAARDDLPFALEVLGFADEEGVRYGTAYLGSTALAGAFDPAVLDRRDADGIAMARRDRRVRRRPAAIARPARDPAGLLGYVEVHIEQGPVLEARGPARRRRHRHHGPDARRGRLHGRRRPRRDGADGATPRRPRRRRGVDRGRRGARRARSTASSRRSARRRSRRARATSSRAASALSLDVRHLDDAVREAAVAALRARAAGDRRRARARGRRGATCRTTPAVACPELTRALEAAGRGRGRARRCACRAARATTPRCMARDLRRRDALRALRGRDQPQPGRGGRRPPTSRSRSTSPDRLVDAPGPRR